MKRIALLILSALPAWAQMNQTLVEGRWRMQSRNPDGLVVLDLQERVQGGKLLSEEWYRNPSGAVTQQLVFTESSRIGRQWSWVDDRVIRVDWSNGIAMTNITVHSGHQRGFSGAGNTGVSVTRSQDGWRQLVLAMARWEVTWTKPPTMCVENGVDQGCYGVSCFEYESSPLATDLRTFATCTIDSGSNTNAIVDIPVPLDTYWKYVGRSECYYCDGMKPCWEFSWPRWWKPPTIAARSGIASVSFQTQVPVNIWRSRDLEHWEWLGTATPEDGTATFTDINAPEEKAFYQARP